MKKDSFCELRYSRHKIQTQLAFFTDFYLQFMHLWRTLNLESIFMFVARYVVKLLKEEVQEFFDQILFKDAIEEFYCMVLNICNKS